MTRLAAEDYLDHIRRDCARLRAVLASTNPGRRVPACPDWDAADLLWHHADVLWFWTAVVRGRPAEPREAFDPAGRPTRPSSYDTLLTMYDEHAAGLVTALEGLEPVEPAWSWSSDHTVGFVLRRQAHEALVHRLDAEQTAGAVTPLDPALAADGVAELVDVMYGGEVPGWGRAVPGPHVVRVASTDADAAFLVRVGRLVGTDPAGGGEVDEPMLLRAEPTAHPDAVVRGTAGDLDAWMWGRVGEDRLVLDGDTGALDALRAVLRTPLD